MADCFGSGTTPSVCSDSLSHHAETERFFRRFSTNFTGLCLATSSDAMPNPSLVPRPREADDQRLDRTMYSGSVGKCWPVGTDWKPLSFAAACLSAQRVYGGGGCRCLSAIGAICKGRFAWDVTLVAWYRRRVWRMAPIKGTRLPVITSSRHGSPLLHPLLRGSDGDITKL